MGQGCSHGSFFSFLQLLPQCLNLTEKMAPLSLVLSLFAFCLQYRKIKIEQAASSPGDVFSFSDLPGYHDLRSCLGTAWLLCAHLIHWLRRTKPQ